MYDKIQLFGLLDVYAMQCTVYVLYTDTLGFIVA